MRFRARLMYDGLAYAGLQFQENAPSIANELQVALAKRTQQDVRVIAAGRTDTGVHARGQAIHFDVDGDRFSDDPEAFQTAVNCMLPQDVRLVQLERAQERDAEGRRWHSMYWATGKLYSYRFHSGHPIGCMDPTQRLYRHQERRGPLCLDRMQAAADYFVGEHDFASFANKGTPNHFKLSGPPPPLLSTVRRVRSITIHDEGDGYARADVHLKGALYKQARTLPLSLSLSLTCISRGRSTSRCATWSACCSRWAMGDGR